MLLVVGSVAVTCACGRSYDGAGDLRAQRVVLEREVEGLRAIALRLERGESLLPPNDVAIAVDEGLVRDLIVAQLPFATDIDRFHVELTGADVQFRGSATVQLRGRLQVRDQPELTADLTLFGALADVRIDQTSSTLLATVAADHLAIAETIGIARYLSGATIGEVARLARLQLDALLPTIRIPVKVQQSIAFPELTDGPVRIAGARMPLEAAVSQVVAARGRLWVSVKVTPGAFAPLEPAAGPVAR
ncbi:MAG: hypothetical protein KA371_14315 [Acidobacteria bacterium]|nr:hypothetical protein [Acidobacteriota bacterium]